MIIRVSFLVLIKSKIPQKLYCYIFDSRLYILTKYGSATKTAPIMISMYRLDMKYGKTNKAIPVIKGTIFFCFFPYIKNPRPIDPKIHSPNKHRGLIHCYTCQALIFCNIYRRTSAAQCCVRRRCKAVVDNYFVEIQLPRLWPSLFGALPDCHKHCNDMFGGKTNKFGNLFKIETIHWACIVAHRFCCQH